MVGNFVVEIATRCRRRTGEEIRQLEVVRSEGGTPSEKTMADREKEMTDLLLKAGGDPARLKKRPGYGEIVKLVGAMQPTGSTAAFVLWKACSSIAHGEVRGLIAYLKNTTVGSSIPPGMQLNQALPGKRIDGVRWSGRSVDVSPTADHELKQIVCR
jgi:hypothetical protein